jgi:alpha-L-rhamnosidase
MKAVRIKINHLFSPIGISDSNPAISWNLSDGIKQTAYRIQAYDEESNILWDSGKVDSELLYAKWLGEPVPPRTRVRLMLKVWDENGLEGEISESFFETGLPVGEEWQARWISGNYRVRKSKRYPVDCFEKFFSANNIVKARLYITACGLYAARINGIRCGNFVLSPGITDYRRRVQYQTYDVTDLVKNGENVIEVELADGWYRGSCGAWGRRNQYGTQTKLLAQLELKKADGSTEIIGTDDTWSWSNDGPIRFADNKDGEKVDERMVPSYSGYAKVARHDVIPTPSDNVPVTEHEHFKAKIIKTPLGKTFLDFGQNMAGYVEFSVKAKAGQKILLRYGEYIDKDGEFTQKNFQLSIRNYTTPLQQTEYICRDGENRYKPKFSIFGFRYVQIESDIEINPEDFTAIAVYSDLETTGAFSCSNTLINKFFENTVWSAKSNMCDLPTDCPTRERHGWSGDAQIFSSTACYLFDYYTFAVKYLNDLYDWQKKNGCLPQIAPEGGTDFYMRAMNGSVGWADAGIIIPYVLWKQYNDRKIIKKYLSGMEKYAAFQMKRCGKWYPTAKRTGLCGKDKRYLNNAGQSYGEWAEPDDVHHMTWKDCVVPHPEVATAYTSYVLSLLAEMEEELDRADKAEEYRQFSNNCKESYRALVKTDKYLLDTDRQARLVRPLALDMLDSEQKKYAEQRLIKALDNYDWRVGTGFLSTPFILDVLKDINPKYAYRLLENEEMPGWLFMPKNGATTVWEAWEGPESKKGGIGSLNHYSKGAVCRFLFDTVCGIKVSGDNEFIVSPLPGGSLTYAKASYKSVYGEITSSWERKEGKTVYTVTVPPGCRAMVKLPSGKEYIQTAGTWEYEE